MRVPKRKAPIDAEERPRSDLPTAPKLLKSLKYQPNTGGKEGELTGNTYRNTLDPQRIFLRPSTVQNMLERSSKGQKLSLLHSPSQKRSLLRSTLRYTPLIVTIKGKLLHNDTMVLEELQIVRSSINTPCTLPPKCISPISHFKAEVS